MAVDVPGNNSSSHARLAKDVVTVTVNNVDDPPLIQISSPEDGVPIGGTVSLVASASDDSGVSSVHFEVQDDQGATVETIPAAESSPGVWTANWDTSSRGEGNYTITAIATDMSGQSSTDSVDVSVTNSGNAATAHIADLDGSTSFKGNGNSGRWTATITLSVHDSAGDPVGNATVIGDWKSIANVFGSLPTGVSGVTNSSGVTTLSIAQLSSNPAFHATVSFSVTAIVHDTFDYLSLANTDPDNDSDGTIILITNTWGAASAIAGSQSGTLATLSSLRSPIETPRENLAAAQKLAPIGILPDRASQTNPAAVDRQMAAFDSDESAEADDADDVISLLSNTRSVLVTD